MLNLRRFPFALLAVFGLAVASLNAQQGRSRRAARGSGQGALHQVRVPHSACANGKRLFTAVYVPKDAAGGPYPFMMERTPYSVGPYGEDQYPAHLGPSEEFQKSGYIFVYQDVRGRWMSEGSFVEMTPHIDEKKTPQDVDDASDTYDTIEFLLKHVPSNNRQGGASGASPTQGFTRRRRSLTRTRLWLRPVRRRR